MKSRRQYRKGFQKIAIPNILLPKYGGGSAVILGAG